jgi:hypothetical protein
MPMHCRYESCAWPVSSYSAHRTASCARMAKWSIMHLTPCSSAKSFSRRTIVRSLGDPKRLLIAVAAVAIVAVVAMMTGCGNSGTDSTYNGASAPSTAPHTAASGPAITDKVAFDQLTLESPAKPSADKNGLVFLRFKYADSDGKVYECVLPRAMSQGQYTLSEWSSTFNAYRLPKVLAQKKINKREEYGDFPFISPKPQAAQPVQSQPGSAGSQPAAIPPLPSPNPAPVAPPPPAPRRGSGGTPPPP